MLATPPPIPAVSLLLKPIRLVIYIPWSGLTNLRVLTVHINLITIEYVIRLWPDCFEVSITTSILYIRGL